MTRTSKLLVTTMVAFTAAAPTALAQSPADEVYNPGGGVLDVVQSATPTPTPTATAAPTEAPQSGVQDETESGTPAAQPEESAPEQATPAQETAEETATPVATPVTETQQATTGDLPFTGFEAGFVALAGLALLAGGFAMRRAARDQS